MRVSIKQLAAALLVTITAIGGLVALTGAPASAASRCSGSLLYSVPVKGWNQQTANLYDKPTGVWATVGYVKYFWEGYYNCAEFVLGNPAGEDYDNTEWIGLYMDGGNNSFYSSDTGDYSSYAGPIRANGTGGRTYSAEGCFWDTDYYNDYYGNYSWQYTIKSRKAYYCASTPYR